MDMINYINDDSTEYLKTIKDCSINSIITDPPYGISFHGKYDPDGDWDKFTIKEFYEFNKKWMSDCYRILKEDGLFWCFCGYTKMNEVIKAAEDVGFTFELGKWKSIQRQKGRGSKKVPKSVREEILCFSKTDNYKFNNIKSIFNVNTTTCTNRLNLSTGIVERPDFDINDKVFYFKMPYYLSKTEKMIHSTQKSILLLSALVLASSDKNDLILDPFMGSGSCGIACKITDRNFIGIEQDSDMVNKAKEWQKNFDVINYRQEFFKYGVL